MIAVTCCDYIIPLEVSCRVTRGYIPSLNYFIWGHMPSCLKLHTRLISFHSRLHAESLEVTYRDFNHSLEATCRDARSNIPSFNIFPWSFIPRCSKLHTEIKISSLEVTYRVSRGYIPRLISFQSRSHTEPLEVTCRDYFLFTRGHMPGRSRLHAEIITIPLDDNAETFQFILDDNAEIKIFF